MLTNTAISSRAPTLARFAALCESATPCRGPGGSQTQHRGSIHRNFFLYSRLHFATLGSYRFVVRIRLHRQQECLEIRTLRASRPFYLTPRSFRLRNEVASSRVTSFGRSRGAFCPGEAGSRQISARKAGNMCGRQSLAEQHGCAPAAASANRSCSGRHSRANRDLLAKAAIWEQGVTFLRQRRGGATGYPVIFGGSEYPLVDLGQRRGLRRRRGATVVT